MKAEREQLVSLVKLQAREMEALKGQKPCALSIFPI
jgi:hypothetical protein